MKEHKETEGRNGIKGRGQKEWDKRKGNCATKNFVTRLRSIIVFY